MHLLPIIIICIFLVVLSVIALFEWRKYHKLKKRLVAPLQLKNEEEPKNLIKAYTLYYSASEEDYKTTIIELKVLKENQSADGYFEDILKLFSTIVPLFAILVTISIASLKDVDMLLLLGFAKGALNFIASIVVLAVFTLLFTRTFQYSTSRTTKLINSHLLIAEDVYNNLSASKTKTSDDTQNDNINYENG